MLLFGILKQLYDMRIKSIVWLTGALLATALSTRAETFLAQAGSGCKAIDTGWPLTDKQSFDAMETTDATVWKFDADYRCAVASRTNNVEAWLLTPSCDMTNVSAVMFSFDHAHKFAGNPAEELTLWVSDEYTGDVRTSDWQQLTIPSYSAQSSWAFIGNTVNVPVAYTGPKTVFGFRYRSTATNNAKWEIRNVRLLTTCEDKGSVSAPLRICGQNLQNYYYNFAESSRPKYNDAAGLAQKTMRIVQSALRINADIYAFCEVEAKPIVLAQLVDSLNKYCGVKDRYAAVADGINKKTDSYDNALKSGFIYRTDKIKLVGANTAASKTSYYKDVMRIQTFEEIASGGKLVLSMNHFKAKDSSADAGESTRNTNAQQLITALDGISLDPDILILGDLNCTVNESPIVKIINAGYTEQLLRFDAGAFSYCYGGKGELIDHVLANASMAKQIVNAEVAHVCITGCGYDNYATTYSDHDACVVDICLQENKVCDYEAKEDLMNEQVNTERSRKVLINGQLYIFVGDELYDIMGRKVKN